MLNLGNWLQVLCSAALLIDNWQLIDNLNIVKKKIFPFGLQVINNVSLPITQPSEIPNGSQQLPASSNGSVAAPNSAIPASNLSPEQAKIEDWDKETQREALCKSLEQKARLVLVQFPCDKEI